MEDQPLGRLLRELPRERADDHFTARVLEGLEGPGRRPARRHGWALATAALLVLLVSAVLVERGGSWNGGRPHGEAREARQARQALEEIRDEHERLARELQRLQSLREEPGAGEVIYLGGNERMDLVLDLGRMPEGTLPASYGSETF